MAPNRPEPEVTQAGFQVLLAIASGHSHGYAVMQFVEQVTEGGTRLGPGTLYRTIARLLADDLLREVAGHDPKAPHDARRRYYRVTDLGRSAVRQQARLHALLARAAIDAGLARELEAHA